MSDWSCEVLQAGALRLDGGGMFGIIPKAMWSTWAHPDESNRIPLQTNCLLLRSSAGTVLVETGCGDKWTDRERAMYGLEDRTIVDAPARSTPRPDEIDLVVVTHSTSTMRAASRPSTRTIPTPRSLRPVFRNAEVVVRASSGMDAVANRSTMTRTYLRSHLDPIDDRLRLVEGGEEVLPGLRVEPVPGHTRASRASWSRPPPGRSRSSAISSPPAITSITRRHRLRHGSVRDHDGRSEPCSNGRSGNDGRSPSITTSRCPRPVDRDARGRHELTNRDS